MSDAVVLFFLALWAVRVLRWMCGRPRSRPSSRVRPNPDRVEVHVWGDPPRGSKLHIHL